MADIIPLRDDPHQDVELLLPWYATGQLDGGDLAFVEAHLAGCERCKAALMSEHRLRTKVRELPLSPDLGWEKLQRHLVLEQTRTSAKPRRDRRRWNLLARPVRPLGIAAIFGAQAAMIALVVVLLRPAASPAPVYHTLGAPTERAQGNVIVVFRPDTTEEAMRGLLMDINARLVDGPTAAGAYVLQVASTRRDASLAVLRARNDILLAQPIDPVPRS